MDSSNYRVRWKNWSVFSTFKGWVRSSKLKGVNLLHLHKMQLYVRMLVSSLYPTIISVMQFQQHLTRSNIKILIAIISTIGIIIWIVTDFFGGMIIHFLEYPILIITVVILYIFSVIETLVSSIRKGLKKNKIKAMFHSFVLAFIISISIFKSDILRSERILTATLKDDLHHYTLILRENSNCENRIHGMFGYSKTYRGEYYLQGDTIIFIEKPYDNDFIPDTMIINREHQAVFKEKDELGAFIQEKEWLNHFEIEE